MTAPPIQSSLRVQIVAVVGVVIVGLLGILSISVLVEGRAYVVDQQTRKAEAAARAFALPIIEAFIVGEQVRSGAGDLLENHIRRFVGDDDEVLYVSIMDDLGSIIAHSDPSRYNATGDSVAIRASRATAPLSSIFPSESHGWVLETVVPLQVGGRRWGAVFLGFDADPLRREIGRLFLLLFVLTAAATGATLGLIYGFVRRFTASLGELVVEVDRIDFEDASPIAVRAPNNEIGYLIHHFDLLKQRLVQSRDQLAAAQHQIYQAEKLASIGRLAAGVAHEVNNPLNGIRFCVHGIRSAPGNVEQTERYVGLIDESLGHMESVVQKLLGFARHRPVAFQQVDLNEQVRKVLDLLAFQLREKEVETQVALDPETLPLHADAAMIQEMLMNLLLNSIDAVDPGGIIRIRTEKDDHALHVSITDNGSGIQGQDLAHIFEPFFSTKDTGKGTGLGLAVTQGIVERHKGSIRVHSVPGKRTTFAVTLPREAA